MILLILAFHGFGDVVGDAGFGDDRLHFPASGLGSAKIGFAILRLGVFNRDDEENYFIFFKEIGEGIEGAIDEGVGAAFDVNGGEIEGRRFIKLKEFRDDVGLPSVIDDFGGRVFLEIDVEAAIFEGIKIGDLVIAFRGEGDEIVIFVTFFEDGPTRGGEGGAITRVIFAGGIFAIAIDGAAVIDFVIIRFKCRRDVVVARLVEVEGAHVVSESLGGFDGEFINVWIEGVEIEEAGGAIFRVFLVRGHAIVEDAEEAFAFIGVDALLIHVEGALGEVVDLREIATDPTFGFKGQGIVL